MKAQVRSIFENIRQGDRVALGQALTLVESDTPELREKAVELLEMCEIFSSSQPIDIRLTISGAPGAGKSTLIEALGLQAIRDGFRVGVITVDPTSQLSHGSILGDKSRMTRLSNSPFAFIRSSPAGEILGGMARRTPELMTLLAAAGYDLILMETVGVGQSEHLAWQFSDGFILVLQPGGGDELQGIKRDITELADIVIVNKADGDLAALAKRTMSQYQQAIHYLSPTREKWSPKIVTCSAIEGTGINDAWQTIRLFRESVITDPGFAGNRLKQKESWLTWSLGQTARELILRHPLIEGKMSEVREQRTPDQFSWHRTEYEIANLMRSLVNFQDSPPETN